ncbi:sensor histidine kinase [Rhabdothermincola salaria]|uniref:sensor histidine kinase n=1 Tax=Rhabdothermincola salaria TaxID=2903142 RepID=UPI001E2F63A8|nr:ATP-binding protein [Rhabdothermincola salaria]MCD9624826.1 ATP-binding protein [Rhabdothermincola salaria]
MVPGWGSGGEFELPYRVLDNAPVGMAISSRSGEVLWANASWCRLAGRGPEELLHEGIDVGVAPEDCSAEATMLEELYAGRQDEVQYRQRWTHPDGRVVCLRISASLEVTSLRTPDSSASAEPVVVRQAVDVTEQVSAERAAADAMSALERRNVALERSNAELDEFSYVVSHDLSEPLRVISGHVELLREEYGDRLGDEATEWIGFAVDGCTRLRRLIDDLLEYSRIGRDDPPRVDVDLDAVVDAALAQLGSMIDDAGAVVTRSELHPVVAVDSEMIQLVTNLLSNAIKFRAADRVPQVHVSSTSDAGATSLTVCDNGIGVPEHQRERVFGMFQRLHGRSAYAGTGVGLAVCRKIARRYDGTITLADNPGGGTCVTVTIPHPRPALAGEEPR